MDYTYSPEELELLSIIGNYSTKCPICDIEKSLSLKLQHLEESIKDPQNIWRAFTWHLTPQGNNFWMREARKESEGLSKEARIQIEIWHYYLGKNEGS